jgi:hypothetical protein
MIVDDLNILRGIIMPAKADPPLAVDPDAVLPCTVAAEFLQAIPGRIPQVAYLPRSVDHQQLPQGYEFNLPELA